MRDLGISLHHYESMHLNCFYIFCCTIIAIKRQIISLGYVRKRLSKGFEKGHRYWIELRHSPPILRSTCNLDTTTNCLVGVTTTLVWYLLYDSKPRIRKHQQILLPYRNPILQCYQKT